jgi:iron complex outermembrane receptor protein
VKDNFTIPDVGGLDNYFLLDLSAGYDLNAFSPGLRIDVTLQNVLNNKHREFIGAPELGRLALARLTYTL